jgi:hypothetical protein
MYPYSVISGFGEECDYITIFHGDDYTLLLPPGCEVAFGWFGSKMVKSVGHFVSNSVKCAGREIGHATNTLQNVAGKVSKGIGKIPLVGTPLHTVFDASYHIALAPSHMAVAIVEGTRIDKVVLNQLKVQLHDFKQVAPYAQMVLQMVPGIGQLPCACISAGLALAAGQSIKDVLQAGALGVMPGGPLVKASATTSTETIQHVIRGDKLDLQSLLQSAGGIASGALGLPSAAKNALVAGVATVGGVVSGKSLDKLLTDAAVMALPLTNSVKKAMTDASAITLDFAHGKRLDTAMTGRINAVMAALPTGNPLRDNIKLGLDATKKVTGGKGEKVMMVALQSGLGDTLVVMGAQPLPDEAKRGIRAGVGLGSGLYYQGQRQTHLNKVTGKLTESGIQLSKTSPLFGAARKLASSKGATQGFDHATGLLQQQVGAGDIAHVRDTLNPTQKIGFDMALSVRVGAVANPKPATLSPEAHAGNAISLGMQSYVPDRKAVIMQTVQSNPSATVGATVAVKEIAANRESWIAKLLKALGINPSKK